MTVFPGQPVVDRRVMPEAAHPLPALPEDDTTCGGKGWKGAPKVPLTGEFWPLDFAAETLGMPVVLLREIIRYLGLPPAGTINMRGFRSQGRIPRAYSSGQLIKIYETVRLLAEELDAETSGDFDGSG